jgi:hypothetical protein
VDAVVEGNMSFATIRPLSEAKRARMGLPPLPSSLLRLVQQVAHNVCEVHEKSNAEPRTHHTTTVTISAMNTHE